MKTIMYKNPAIPRKRNLFLMYQPKYFSRYMLSVSEAVNPDAILYIEAFDAPHQQVAAEQVRLADFPASQYANSRVFLFDYFSRPISKIAQILHAKGAEIIFVQHGSIFHLESEIQTGAKRIFWKRLANRLSIMAQIARLALRTGQLFRLRKNPRKLDIDLLESAYIFISEDIRFFKDIDPRLVLCQSVDAKRFQLDPNAAAIFISQPLIEDGIVEAKKYFAIFDRLVEHYNVTRMIAHPRDRVLADHARAVGMDVFALQDQKSFGATSIVGHYSTLLYEIQGVGVIRLSYESGDEIETFRGESHEGTPFIVDALKERFSP